MTCDELIAALEACTIAPAEFTHRAHMQVGFDYLQRDGYAGALASMPNALRRFAAHHGKHGLYHETVTVAFLTLIHERMAGDLIALRCEVGDLEWESFAGRHADLFTSDLLGRYYSKDTLRSELARRCFVLPCVAKDVSRGAVS